ncbi:MAG: rhomboid family intramembrane serine protease [Crocinitomicaceae bacterium]
MFSITFIIIGLTVLISYQGFSNDLFKEKSMYMPYRVKYNKEYYRIMSHVFVHGDWGHLCFNMFSLYFLGSFLETQWASEFGPSANYYFIALYFGGGVFATLWPFYRNCENELYRSLGASGAVSSVIFGAMLWQPELELYLMFIPIPIKAYVLGPLYLLYEYYSMKRGGSGIAHDAHLGGALFGILFVLLIDSNKGIEFLALFL